MTDKILHNDPFFEACKNAFEDYQPGFNADDLSADWAQVKSNIVSPQGVKVSKPDISGGFKTLLNLKNIIISTVAGVAIVATTVILLNTSDNKEIKPAGSQTNMVQSIPMTDSNNTVNESSNALQITPSTFPSSDKVSQNNQQPSGNLNTPANNNLSATNQQNMPEVGQNPLKPVQQPQNIEPANQNSPKIFVTDRVYPGQNEIYISDTQLCQSQLLNIRYNLADQANQKLYVSLQGKALYPSENQFSYQFNKAGWYNLTLVIQNYSTTYTKLYRILVVASPVASFGYSLNGNHNVKFSNQSKYADNYRWQFGDNSTTAAENPDHRYFDTGIYKVRLIAATDGVCSDTAIKYIHVQKLIDIDIPNTFSPNNDGINDEFYIKIENETLFELTIFDRNSNLVFSSKNKDEKWNGTYKDSGKQCPAGTYFYFLNYQVLGQDQPKLKNGTISLFK